MKVRKASLLTLILLCACSLCMRAYAAGSDKILGAWADGGVVSAQIACGAVGANACYAAFDEEARFIGAEVVPVASGTEDVYTVTAFDGAARGRVFLLSADGKPLCPALDVGDKPEEPETGPKVLTVGGVSYSLGMSEADLLKRAGEPIEKLSAVAGYQFYVYGTQTYQDFFMAGVRNGQVAALCSGGPAFSWNGAKVGDTGVTSDTGYATLYTDKNDGYILHAVLLFDPSLSPYAYNNSSEALYGESRANFHMTNAFRLYHGRPLLQWSDAAAEAARLHSQDMADQNYFSHDSLDGRNFSTRMKAQGISRMSAAENISAGRSSGVAAYDGWVNSSGHRNNMLSAQRYLGVGSAYNASSTYRYYATQDFYS